MESIVARNTKPSNHCAVVTAISKEELSSPTLSPTYKKVSSQHHPHHDEETTAYSSWHDDDDNGSINSSSQLSSIDLQDDSNNDHIAATTWVIEEDDRGLVLVSSTSERSLLNLLTEDENNNDDVDGCHSINEDDCYGYSSVSFQTESKRALHEEEEETCNSSVFQELSERACLLLQKERCPDYTVEDYFQRSYYASARNYCCNDDTASSTSDLTDDGERRQYLIPDTTRNNNSIPIDQSCRSKMMEWSFRLVEFSFPPPSVLQQEQQSAVDDETKTNQNTSRRTTTRKHSIEALQIITTTFSYIDRLCTKYKIVDRDEFKLLSMICMNIAAKASGFFGAENEKEWHDYSSHHYFNDDTRAQHQQQEEEVDLVQSCCQNDSPTRTTVTTSPSSKTSSDLIDSNMSKDACSSGQTIISTPAGSRHNYSSSSSESQQQQLPRPPLDLISLPGLHTLCNGLFTMDQFNQMEYVILHHGLNWRLNSTNPIAWVDLSLDLTRLLLIDGNKCLTGGDCDDIREAVLVQLEYAIDISSFARHAPSLIGIAAFLNVVEEYSDDEGYDESILDCIEEVFGLSLEKTGLREVRFMMMFQVDEAEYIGLVET